MEQGSQVARIAAPGPDAAAWPVGRGAAILGHHWLMAALLVVGAGLRALVMIAYQPALLYTDSLKYLYNAWPATDPVGYKAPLRLILWFGNLGTVAAIQHALGLSMAITIYVLLVRRGMARWLAGCAVTPVLLDAYQLQIEQTILPDVWFEALIVAGLAVLLRPSPLTPWAAAAGGMLLGFTATVREVGAILILPALIYVAVRSRRWRRAAKVGATLAVAFAVPIVAYCSISFAVNGHFRLSHAGASQAYGRVALASDCATLRMPSYEQALCPTGRQRSLLGTDGLDHAPTSPLVTYVPPPGMSKPAITASFVRTVLLQQPLNVLRGVAGDATQLFALTRNTRPGDTSVSRWQFQVRYPVYGQRTDANHTLRFIAVNREGFIVVGLNRSGATAGPYTYQTLRPSMGNRAIVNKPLAGFLRAYQLNGGSVPGPLYAFAALAGLLGCLTLFRRRAGTDQRDLACACLLACAAAAALLLTSDAFEFSWRYQLPALVTLFPAGALGIAAMSAVRSPERDRTLTNHC